MAIIYKNKQAYFNYEILKTWEAGLVLLGHEVKSIKTGHISLKGSYISIKNGEAWLRNARISPYKMAGNLVNYDPDRERKILLNKKEIKYLIGKLQEKGLTLVPLRVYTKHNKIKIEIGLGKGKSKIDKRASIRKREDEKKMRRAIKHGNMIT